MKKKIGVVLTTAILAVGSMVPMSAMANNYTDSDWSFTIATGGTGYIAGARSKTDTTDTYIKCTAGTGTFIATPYGSTAQNGTYSNREYKGCVASSYIVGNNGKYYMPNFIYESGGTWAKVHYNAKYASYTTFKGVWSPDSIGR